MIDHHHHSAFSWQHAGVVHMSFQPDDKVAQRSLCLAYAAQRAMICPGHFPCCPKYP